MLRVCSVHAIASGVEIRRDELRVAAFVDAVLGPRARIVLHARDLDDRHAARRVEAPHAVAVRVPGEVAGDRLAACDHRAQRFAVVGVDAEVVVVALGRARVPRVVVAEHEHRRRSTRPRARRATRAGRS